MSTYSFLDVVAAISGPGGAFSIGSDAGVAEEGITVDMNEDKDNMVTGADGSVMHSLHAGKAGKLTVRLLKTSPTNALLGAMYNLQTTSSANHGRNTIVVSDKQRGDIVSCREAAFAKFTALTYGKEAGMNEWVFNVGKVDQILGAGVPDVNL